MKKQAKGIYIFILLIVLIALIILSFTIPKTSSQLPEIEKATLSEEIQKDLSEDGDSEKDILKTYEITEEDLNTYEKNEDYKPGRTNPFEQI